MITFPEEQTKPNACDAIVYPSAPINCRVVSRPVLWLAGNPSKTRNPLSTVPALVNPFRSVRTVVGTNHSKFKYIVPRYETDILEE